MVQHIYGKVNLMKHSDRPNMFIKELHLYVNYLKDKIDEINIPLEGKQKAYYDEFKSNLEKGISYYRDLFDNMKDKYSDVVKNTRKELDSLEIRLRESLN